MATQPFRVQFVSVDTNGLRDKIRSHLVDAPDLTDAKRKANKLAQADPIMGPIVSDDSASWHALNKHSEIKHYGSEHSVAGNYIHVYAIKARRNLWTALAAGAAALFASALIIWFSLMQPTGKLANSLKSVDAAYGRCVIRACNSNDQINFAKLLPIVKDYNKSVGIDRSYVINSDYANMIEDLTGGSYTLRYSYIVTNQ